MYTSFCDDEDIWMEELEFVSSSVAPPGLSGIALKTSKTSLLFYSCVASRKLGLNGHDFRLQSIFVSIAELTELKEYSCSAIC